MIKLTKLTALTDLQACADRAAPRNSPVRAVDVVPALQKRIQMVKQTILSIAGLPHNTAGRIYI